MAGPRCKIGQRAILLVGPNSGRLVQIESGFTPGSKHEGSSWPSANKWPWIIRSLGSPFRIKSFDTREDCDPSMTMAANDEYLMPLPDVKPKARRRKQKAVS